MDPTSLLIQVEGNFGPSKRIENTRELLPRSFRLSGEAPILTAQIRTEDYRDINNLPAVYLSDVNKRQEVLEKRLSLDNYSEEELARARRNTNPYEEIGNSIFMNRSAIKLANIDAVYNFALTGHLGAYLSLQTNDLVFKYVDLAGAPGGFVQYIQWRLPASMGYGMSLKEKSKPGGPVIPTWNFNLLDEGRFFPYYGPSDTGNLYFEWQNLVNRVRGEQAYGVDLVTGDAGFDIEREKAYARQEFLYSRIFLVQLLAALKLLRTDGNFLVKVFDTVTELSAQIIWLAALSFEEITLFKPISSRPANAEKYLICFRKRPETAWIEQILEEASKSYNQEENVTNLLATSPPDDFVEWLTERNDQLLDSRYQYLNKVIQFLNGQPVKIPLVDAHQALISWCLPGQPITRKSRIQLVS